MKVPVRDRRAVAGWKGWHGREGQEQRLPKVKARRRRWWFEEVRMAWCPCVMIEMM